MKNRAKCKLCQSVIESFHATDLVTCKCGEKNVYGGEALKCSALNWQNFLRIDDQGNEIIVKVEGESLPIQDHSHKPSKNDLIDMLDEMVKNIENLPNNAMLTPITHYDLCSALILISSILKHQD